MPLIVFTGSSEDQTTPMLVTALKGLKVLDVACGSGDAQTLAVTENGEQERKNVPTGDGLEWWFSKWVTTCGL